MSYLGQQLGQGQAERFILGQQLGQGQAERFIYTATGGETSVTSDDLGRAVAYTVGQVDVYLNGAKLINGSDFTATTGTSITGLAALTASDVVEVFALSIFQASDTVSAASGGTFNGNVTVDANLSVTGTVDIDTSLNVDGTVTADGLTVDDGTILVRSLNDTGNSSPPTVRFEDKDPSQAAGQKAGQIEFYTSDVSPGPAGVYAYVNAQAESTSGLGALYFGTGQSGSAADRLKVASNGDISFYEDTGTTPKFFWDASAETLSIGSPSADNVTLYSTDDVPRLEFEQGGTVYATIGHRGASAPARQNIFEITTNQSEPMAFRTNDTEAMRIDSSGNLLVGTTSVVSGSGTGLSILPEGQLRTARTVTTASNHYVFYNGNGLVGTISTSGSATAYNTSSDYRLKDVDGPITNSGAYIDALKPVQGSWKADGSRFIGLIAHEVQEVSETPVATGEKDGEEMQGMDYSAPELIANLIAEIQSLRARVAQLEGV